MVFEAKNTPSGVMIDNTLTQIKNITGQQNISEGIVIISKEKATYIPNNISDFTSIIDFLIELVPQISSSTTYPNPTWTATSTQFITKLNTIKEALK